MLAEANKVYRRVTSSSFVAICFSQQRTNTSSRYSLYNRAEQGWGTARELQQQNWHGHGPCFDTALAAASQDAVPRHSRAVVLPLGAL